MLASLVRRGLDRPDVRLLDWRIEQLHGGFEVSAKIFRIYGTATHGERQSEPPISWSLILKTLPPQPEEADPAYWNYLPRDRLAYQSGLLDNLPGGLVAPRCYDIVQWPDGESWLWLEEVRDECGTAWPLSRYGLAARHLGQFNAAYLLERPIPSWPWLSRRWLRSLMEESAAQIARLPRHLKNPLVQRLLPPDVNAGLFRLWEDRHLFMDALDRLPQTLVHRDAFRRNLFSRQNKNGQVETVAIDWVFTGAGSLGEELGPLVAATIGFRELEFAQIQALEDAVFDGYLRGLGDAGWRGDPEAVRFSYVVSAALRYVIGGSNNLLPIFLDEAQHNRIVRMWGGPMTAYAAHWGKVFRFLLHRIGEARARSNRTFS